MLAGLVSSEAPRGGSVPEDVHGHLLPVSPIIYSLFMSVSIVPLFIRTTVILDLGPTLITSF